MERLNHDVSHRWHVAINRFHDNKIGTPQWRRWLYDAKTLADEVPRLVRLFKREREGNNPAMHQHCSLSQPEPVTDNHLTCCLGVECRACPELLALEQIDHGTPEEIDTARAWTCAAHIMSEGGDRLGEGFLLTVDDRMFWDRTYRNMAGADDLPPSSLAHQGKRP